MFTYYIFSVAIEISICLFVDLILSAEVVQPLLSDKEQIASIQAVNISTAQNQVMIRHHLVEGGCFTNTPWTQQWSTSCPDGLQISSANDTMTITKGEIQFAIQHFVSKSGHSQLQLTVDLKNFTQGHGGLLGMSPVYTSLLSMY